jgi:hypothetical protein
MAEKRGPPASSEPTTQAGPNPPEAGSLSETESGQSAWWQNIQVIGGLTAVFLGLSVVLIVSVLAVSFVRDDAEQVAAIAGSAFTVIGTLVGAYFGVKIGTDQTKTAMEQTDRAHSALREEAAKAQAFAAHVPPSEANRALRDAKDLASERPSAPPSKER